MPGRRVSQGFKSNSNSKFFLQTFDDKFVLKQICSSGILESILLAKWGFFIRNDFIKLKEALSDIVSAVLTNINISENFDDTNTNFNNQIDHFLQNSLDTYFKRLDSDIILDENLSGKISFLDEQGYYLDCFQLIFLCTRIKGIYWSFSTLFNFLKEQFIESNDGSVRRLSTIFFYSPLPNP